MVIQTVKRPKLTQSIALDQFRNYYWLKAELMRYCREHGLSTQGLKQELVARIETFIATGIKSDLNQKNSPILWDSEKLITKLTPVVNYKNDAATRQFFVEQIGTRFHFNAYLRQFADKNNLKGRRLTYGDLVDGWLLEESRKKGPGVIISQLNDRTQLENLLEKDPFKINNIADYEIIEFNPNKYHPNFASFIEKA